MKHAENERTANVSSIPSERQLSRSQLAAMRDDLVSRIRVKESTRGKVSARPWRGIASRRSLPALTALIVGIAFGALTTTFAVAQSDPTRADAKSLSRISTKGTLVQLTPRSQSALDFSRRQPGGLDSPQSTGQARLMAKRGTAAFFRILLADGNACFYTGRSVEESGTYELGGGSCWTPAPRFPILDLSPIQADGPGGFQVLQIQGFAADGVKTIGVADARGDLVAEVAVKNNVYKITAYPPGGVVELRAYDGGRNVLQRVAYSK